MLDSFPEVKYALIVFKNGLEADLLKSHLDHESDLSIKWIIRDLDSCLADFRVHPPGLIILDVSPPSAQAIDTAEKTRTIDHQMRLLLIDQDFNRIRARRAETLRAAYVTKSCSLYQLVNSIRLLVFTPFIIPSESNGLVESPRHYLPRERSSGDLTQREHEVLSLLAQGESSRGIAEALGLKTTTVANHRQRMMNKLKVRSSTELIRVALSKGLIDA